MTRRRSFESTLRLGWMTVLLLAAGGHLVPDRAQADSLEPEIAFERYTLTNGLEVILHVDKTVPLAHVEVHVRSGAADDPPGRAGLAHVIEHLMFQGTRHFPAGAYARLLADAGASLRMGEAGLDDSRYRVTLPAGRLELGLWLESSRLGFLLDRPGLRAVIRQEVDLVREERRQRAEATPTLALRDRLLRDLYPGGHPNDHDGLGDDAQLSAIDESDVREFWASHYAPNNVTLVIAGDFDAATTKGLVEKYFGPIPRGPAIARRPAGAALEHARVRGEPSSGEQTAALAWRTVPAFAPGDAELDVIARLLGGGRSSRLVRRLVHDLKIARRVDVVHVSLARGGRLEIAFTTVPGRGAAEVERVIDEELERLRKEPVDERELATVLRQLRAETCRGVEALPGRAAALARYAHLARDAGYLARDLQRYRQVDAAGVQAWARTLSPPIH